MTDIFDELDVLCAPVEVTYLEWTRPVWLQTPKTTCTTKVDWQSLLKDGGSGATYEYESWLINDKRKMTKFLLENFHHEKIYQLSVSDIEKVAFPDQNNHALGDVNKYEEIKEVEDYTTTHPISYIFHTYIEKYGKIPFWLEFKDFFENEASECYMDHFIRDFNYENLDKTQKIRYDRALRWRIGKAYYSFLRELDVLIRLRNEYGLDVKHHLLADTVLKTDLWVENVALGICVLNDTMHRKVSVTDVFGQDGSITPIMLSIRPRFVRGRPWFIEKKLLDDIAARICRVLESK